MKAQFDRHVESLDGDNDQRSTKVHESAGTIPCDCWEIDAQPILLPSLPALPDLMASSNTEPNKETTTKITQIAGLDGYLIGLTNKGHVLKYGPVDNENTVAQGTWKYVRIFLSLSPSRIRH